MSFLCTGCPASDVGVIYLAWNDKCMGYWFCPINPTSTPTPNDSVQGLYFLKNGLSWTCFVLNIHTKLTIFLWGVSGWSTDPHCGVCSVDNECHLPPVWWSTYMFMFLNDSRCVNLICWRGIFYSVLPLFWSLCTTHVSLLLFLSNYFTLNSLYILIILFFLPKT